MKHATAVYVFLNLAGILLFAWFIYSIDAQARAEERDYRDAVDGVTFFTTAVPVFLVCAIGSCAWVVKVVIDLIKKRGFQSMIALFGVVSAWTLATVSLRFLLA